LAVKDILDFLSKLPGLPPEQWMGLICLGVLGLCDYALYVVHCAVSGRSGK
jgi:hypothetical protein